jgi:spoIIIJ-associated protein
MAERTTLEVIAASVEEALAQGLAQLGLPAEAVSVEVLDAGNKGFLGLGGRQVRVRLTVNPPPGTVVPVAEKPAVSTPDVKPAPVKKAAPAPEENDRTLELAEEFTSKLLHLLKFQAQVSAHYDDDDREGRRSVRVDVHGNDLSVLIGRHSETLGAFQYLVALMISKETQEWAQVVVDVEGYRSRRERQLRQMATRLAEQVTKTGRRQVLEPMPASERRIIHIELREHPTVTTESVGEEPRRKITIIPKSS